MKLSSRKSDGASILLRGCASKIFFLLPLHSFEASGRLKKPRLNFLFGTGRSEYLISKDLNAPSVPLLDLELRTLMAFHPPGDNCNIMR